MIEYFVKTELAVKDCYLYKAVRDVDDTDSAGKVQYFDVACNLTDPTMQQINVSVSKKNTIRGIHVSGFSKVAFCLAGRIFDVCVDMRPNSPTFKKWCGAWLDKDTHIYIPSFCGHALFSAEDDSVICYYMNGIFFDHLDYTISYNDPQLEIKWPQPIDSDSYILSDKDQSSGFITQQILDDILFRIESPVEHFHKVTNTDILLFCKDIKIAAPLIVAIKEREGIRAQLLRINALDRESVECAINQMRPKISIIYHIKSNEHVSSTSLYTELLNILIVCQKFNVHLVILTEFDNKELALIKQIIEEESYENILILIGQCMISHYFSNQETAIKFKENEVILNQTHAFTNLDTMASKIIDLSLKKDHGIIHLIDDHPINMKEIINLCKENGLDIELQFEEEEERIENLNVEEEEIKENGESKEEKASDITEEEELDEEKRREIIRRFYEETERRLNENNNAERAAGVELY